MDAPKQEIEISKGGGYYLERREFRIKENIFTISETSKEVKALKPRIQNHQMTKKSKYISESEKSKPSCNGKSYFG